VQGRKVKCKSCGTTFTVPPAPAAKGPAPARTAPAKKPASPAKGPAKPGAARARPGTGLDAPESNPYSLLDDDAALAAITKANAPTKLPEPGSAEARGFDRDGNPYGITTLDLSPRCPHCAKEMEDEEAIVCLHCGYNTQTRLHARTMHIYHTTSGDRLRWLLPGILCVLLILALIGFDVWFVFGLQSTWDSWDDSMGHESFSRGARVFGVLITVFVMWHAARFAFLRLILHPTPPEVEKN
jgi:hypothetical protein